MQTNKIFYDLPDDLWLITRATFDSEPLPLLSYGQMDRDRHSWEEDTGPGIEALVYNLRNVQEIRIYPIPNDDFPIEYYSIGSDFGVTTEFEDADVSDVFGVLSNIESTPGDTVTFDSVYGVVVDAYEGPQLVIHYIRDPLTLLLTTDELEIPPMFDTALKHYVIGHAFLDDLDTENQNRGTASLAMYDNALNMLGNRTKERDATRSTQYQSKYRGFV